MIFAHKKKSHTQEVGEHETVKISLLKRNGWRVVEESPEQEPEPVEPAEPAEYLNENTGDLKPSKLPDDFPGVDALRAAGITTFDKVFFASAGDLTEIKGIGQATADRIHAAIQ